MAAHLAVLGSVGVASGVIGVLRMVGDASILHVDDGGVASAELEIKKIHGELSKTIDVVVMPIA